MGILINGNIFDLLQEDMIAAGLFSILQYTYMGGKQMSSSNLIHTLDLNFMGMPGTIAAYLIPHAHGGILIESGPGSTLPVLQEQLGRHGLSAADITDVLLTHIHLDHAGAAGWLARQGARIHVHPAGAVHLCNPEKLLNSAARIYGPMMETLWGEFLPVPEERLSVVQAGDEIEIEGLTFRAIDTPGHANHHYAYLLGEALFSGDVGGIRLPGRRHLRLPMPPPEFNLEEWRLSLERLKKETIRSILPTHFGLFPDADWHLAAIEKSLDEVEDWIEATMPAAPPVEALGEQFMTWTRERSLAAGLAPAELDAYELANPSWMSTHGIQRYWRKHRSEAQ